LGDTGVVLAAAGQGKRMLSQVNKVFLELRGQPVIKYSLDIFEKLSDIREIIIVAHPQEVSRMKHDIVDHSGHPYIIINQHHVVIPCRTLDIILKAHWPGRRFLLPCR
jgi:2-C-methyl-D-erythritol 4-phosphate cytidylyltransferase